MSTLNSSVPGSTLPANGGAAVLWAIGAIVVLALFVPGLWWGYAGLAVVSVAAVVYALAMTLRGEVDPLLLGWILIFPLGYYFLSFPQQQPWMTLDRALLGVVLVGALVKGPQQTMPMSRTLGRAAGYWAVFVVVAAISIPRAASPANASRVLLEAFIFPALVAWYVWRNFDVRKHLATLHVVTCVMSLYVAGIGLAEVALQRDLLATADSGIMVAGDYGSKGGEILVRPNGPFATSNSFALVGLVSFFFLLFLKNALGEQTSPWRNWLHRLGVAAALLAACMPVFRSVFTSMVVILLADIYYTRGKGRAKRVSVMACALLVVLALQWALPAVVQERSDPANLYGRIAQQKQTLMLFLDHPIAGVGIVNFVPVAQASSSKYRAYYEDYESADSPHNNFGAILAETGIIGFLPFMISSVCLLLAFWRLSGPKVGALGTSWRMAFYILLGYWINGLSISSIYFEDLNLWYLFALAVCYKYLVTETTTAGVPVMAA